MPEKSRQDTAARLRVTIEEELAGLRRFSDVPSAELEEMAERIARAVLPFVGESATARAA